MKESRKYSDDSNLIKLIKHSFPALCHLILGPIMKQNCFIFCLSQIRIGLNQTIEPSYYIATDHYGSFKVPAVGNF